MHGPTGIQMLAIDFHAAVNTPEPGDFAGRVKADDRCPGIQTQLGIILQSDFSGTGAA